MGLNHSYYKGRQLSTRSYAPWPEGPIRALHRISFDGPESSTPCASEVHSTIVPPCLQVTFWIASSTIPMPMRSLVSPAWIAPDRFARDAITTTRTRTRDPAAIEAHSRRACYLPMMSCSGSSTCTIPRRVRRDDGQKRLDSLRAHFKRAFRKAHWQTSGPTAGAGAFAPV